MNKEREKMTIPVLCGLLFIALCVCMMSPLNPLSRNVPGTDSSVFLTIAQGMLNGKLPYVDFFDHKGPLIYFINAAGLFIGGWTGVWGIELLFMFVSVFFAYKTALFFAGTFSAFWGTAFSFAALTPFFQRGNLTEEYVLPFIFISLYIFTKYYFTQAEPGKIHIVILGACFGISLLLRPNMFAIWFSFCIVIFVQKLLQKEYKSIVQYILFFCSGIIFTLLPVLLYLKITGALEDCIDQYIVFNRIYMTSSARASATFFSYVKSFIIAVNRALVPFLIALAWLLLEKPLTAKYGFYIGYAISWVISFFLIGLSRMNYGHYYMVLIPLFVPVLSYCTDKLFKVFYQSKYVCIKYGLPILFLCAFFNHQVLSAARIVYGNINSGSRIYFSELGKFINDNTSPNDTISVLGNQCVSYLFTDRDSASKYIYQLPLVLISPKIKMEYVSDIQKMQPEFLIIPLDGRYERVFEHIFGTIGAEYYEYFNLDRHVIYKRK